MTPAERELLLWLARKASYHFEQHSHWGDVFKVDELIREVEDEQTRSPPQSELSL